MRGTTRYWAVAACAAMCAASAEARADEPSPVPATAAAPAPPPERRRWYGGEILATDLASLTVFSLAVGAKHAPTTPVLAGISAAGYVFGGPVVHGANGAGIGTIAGSLGLRVGLPLLGVAVGAAAGAAGEGNCHGDGLCGLSAVAGGILGMGVGIIVASVVDISALAWKSDSNAPVTAAPPSHALRLAPLVGVNREGGRGMPTLGVAGSF